MSAFTYTPDAPDDLTRVRFHVGDTVDGENYLSDDEIRMAISESGGDYRQGVILAIQLILAKLSKADFTADWLNVSNKTALDSYTALLLQKRQLFHIPAVVGREQMVQRSDSQLEPDSQAFVDLTFYDDSAGIGG